MAWHTLRKFQIENWFDRYFPTFLGGIIIGVFTLLFSIVLHGCCEKISNESSYKYRLDINDIHGHSSIYLNEGEFDLKDGRISFEKDGTVYYFTNFRLTDISK